MLWFVVKPAPVGVLPAKVEGPQLFSFEKHELVRIEVTRPDQEPIILVEQDGAWIIEGPGHGAGRTMVNRVKHQIHQLTARATVIEASDEAELYGLGENAIRVSLTLRDGREIAFRAGDPNPSAVSYYVQPEPGDLVYTVQKAAMDYYSLTLDSFRETRFASFDSKDVTRMVADVAAEGITHRLELERVGDRQWQMHTPLEMAANTDGVRRLMGRVAALKARHFHEVDPSVEGWKAAWGLDAPQAEISLSFTSREPLLVVLGSDAPKESRFEEQVHVWLGGETVFVARRGLLEDFAADPLALRDRSILRMEASDVVAVDATLRAEGEDDLAGTQGVRFAAEQWVWADGVPVSGSTPDRVARTVSGLEVVDFLGPGDPAEFGLDDPLARIILTDVEGRQVELLLGDLGEPEEGAEGRSIPRRHVAIAGAAEVYLAPDRALTVVRDLIREGNRKAERDAEKAKRRERIPSLPDETEDEG